MAEALTQGKKASKKGNVVGEYLQQYALGLTAKFAEIVSDTMGCHPSVQEQKLHIRAMRDFIKICGPYVRITRPHVGLPNDRGGPGLHSF